MEKDSWIIQVEQLQEWLTSLNEKDSETVKGQIEDILEQTKN